MGEARLVVFDLDGVIARTDTMAYLLQKQLLSNPGRVAIGLVPAGLWFAFHRIPRVRPVLSRSLGRAALSGLSEERYVALAAAAGERLGEDPSRRIADGLAAVRRHQAAGDQVIVTTGTERTVARAFLDAAGLTDVDLLATELRFGRRLVRYARHNLGRGKLPALAGREIALFYTDSDLDLPVARLAARTVLVNPTPRLEHVFARHAGNVEVVRWQ